MKISNLKSLIKAFNLKNTGFLEQEHTIDPSIKRKSVFLKHSIFSSFTSETEMMRYIHKLETKDLARRTNAVCFGSLDQRSQTSRQTIQRFLQMTIISTTYLRFQPLANRLLFNLCIEILPTL